MGISVSDVEIGKKYAAAAKKLSIQAKKTWKALSAKKGSLPIDDISLTPTHGPEHLMQNNIESAGDITYCGNGRTILETELFNYWTITITRTLQQMDGIKALSI